MVLFKGLVEGRLGLVTSHIAYVRVFDRHRQLVFEQQGYKSDWDGKYQKSKKPLPAGPYYYIVQLNDGSAARSGWLYITY
jgi:gliding motility-associated-like protein